MRWRNKDHILLVELVCLYVNINVHNFSYTWPRFKKKTSKRSKYFKLVLPGNRNF